jgi:hypothetical protein
VNFRQYIAKYVCGHLTSDELPKLGVAGLEQGLDTPSLRILAGLNRYDSPFEVEHYFKLAITELNIQLPDKRQAALEYAVAIVEDILEGKKDVIAGTREIHSYAIASYDFFSENKRYCYDSIGFEQAYGLLDTSDDLSGALEPWSKEKSNQELLAETRAELLAELKKWKEYLTNGA